MKHLHFKGKIDRKRYLVGSAMASAIGYAIIGGGMATGIAAGGISAYKGGQEKKKAKGEQEQREREDKKMMEELMAGPDAPTGPDAQEQARLMVEKKRRMRALSGGKTILSSEAPSTVGGGKTLLGS